MNKFITLTQCVTESRLDINPIMISEMKICSIGGKIGTTITMMNGNAYTVIEDIDQLHKLIDKSNSTTLTTWETGPR